MHWTLYNDYQLWKLIVVMVGAFIAGVISAWRGKK